MIGALVVHPDGNLGCNRMTDKRIMLTVTRKLDEFLERMAEETGIDRSNLIRTWIWERMQAERDRSIAEAANKRQK